MAHDRVTNIQTATGVFLAVIWITACMRVYVKRFMSNSYALEDWLSMVGTVFFSTMAACFIGATIFTKGHDMDDVQLLDLVPAMQYWYFGELSYALSICFIKISVAVFLLRIVTSKIQRLVLFIAIGVFVIVTIIFFFVLMFQCTPVSYAWTLFGGNTNGSCIPPNQFGAITYTHSAVNAIGDLLLAIMPIVVVTRLQMNPRMKITVCVLLSMGLSAFIASIVRIPYLELLIQNPANFTYLSVNVALWSAIEPGLAITAANIAVLRPLFSAFFGHAKLWNTTTNSQLPSTQNGTKNLFSFSHRRGYMRSDSGGNTADLGLQDIEQSGHQTKIGGQDRVWTDIEMGNAPGGKRVEVSNWPLGITKTVRLDVRSENGEQTYGDIVASLNPPRGRKVGDTITTHKSGGSRDLGKPLEGGLSVPRPQLHTRNESSNSTLTKLAMDETTRIFGVGVVGPSSDVRSESGTRTREKSKTRMEIGRVESPEPLGAGTLQSLSLVPRAKGSANTSQSSFVMPGIKTQSKGSGNSSQSSLVMQDTPSQLSLVTAGVVREGKREDESPAGFGLGVWDLPEDSNRDSEPGRPRISHGRRVSHVYKNSE